MSGEDFEAQLVSDEVSRAMKNGTPVTRPLTADGGLQRKPSRRVQERRRRSRLLDHILSSNRMVPLDSVHNMVDRSPAKKAMSRTAPLPTVPPQLEVDAAAQTMERFPSWLMKRSDFAELQDEPLTVLLARRDLAEGYIASNMATDAVADEKYFQGPRRTTNARRGAILHTYDLGDAERWKQQEQEVKAMLEKKRGGSPTGRLSPPRRRGASPPHVAVEATGGTLKRHVSQQGFSWEKEKGEDTDSDEDRQRILSALEIEKESKVRKHRNISVDPHQAERLIQKAFVVRARSFGLRHPDTRRARQNLLKCYMAQNKLEEAKDVRDSIEAHLVALERSLAGFEAEARKQDLSHSLKYMTKAAALTAMLTKNVTDEQLALQSGPRTVSSTPKAMKVPRSHPDTGHRSTSTGPFKLQTVDESVSLMVPPQVAPNLRFEGLSASDRLADWNALKGVTDRRTTDTLVAARASAIVPPLKRGDAPRRALRVADRPMRNKLKAEAKQALATTNFGAAASLARQGLELGNDQALLAMFRASIGKLSEFPRSVDFQATATLSTAQPDHILGESLVVDFFYVHDSDVPRGVDRAVASSDATGATEIARPGQHLGMTAAPRPKAGARPHSTSDWIGLFRVNDRKASVAAGTTSADGRVCLNERLEFGDGKGTPAETLLGWCIAPEGNNGYVVFEGVPVAPGLYRLRYFLHGTRASLGAPLDVEAGFVKCKLEVPREVFVGDPVEVAFNVAYRQDHGRSTTDWVGLFVVADPQDDDKDKDDTERERERSLPPLYDPAVAIDVQRLGEAGSGTVVFKSHPCYPGRYEVRLYTTASLDSCAAVSLPIVAKLPFLPFERSSRLVREVRVYISASFKGSHLERNAMVRLALPRLRHYCADRNIAVSFVDLRAEPQTSRGVTLDLEEVAQVALQEVESCRPFVAGLIGQDYGAIPPNMPLWLGHAFPWLNHYANPELPNSRGRGVAFRAQAGAGVAAPAAATKPTARSRWAVGFRKPAKPAAPQMTPEQRQSMALFGRLKGKALANSTDTLPKSQDLGFTLALASVFEMEMVSAYALPRMRTEVKDADILRMAKLLASQAAVAEAKATDDAKPAGKMRFKRSFRAVKANLRNLTAQNRVRFDADLTRHCHLYSRHPSLIVPSHSSVLTFATYDIQSHITEMALLDLRNASSRRNDKHRSGYVSVNELVEWVFLDLCNAIDREFPKREAPHPLELPTVSSEAFALSRIRLCVMNSTTDALFRRLDGFVTDTSDAVIKPLVVAGSPGAGKSSLVALWGAHFYSDHCKGRSTAASFFGRSGARRGSDRSEHSGDGAAGAGDDGDSKPAADDKPAHRLSPVKVMGVMSAFAAAGKGARVEELMSSSQTAPARMGFTVEGIRYHLILIHVGELGGVVSASDLLLVIADELELATGQDPDSHVGVAAANLRLLLLATMESAGVSTTDEWATLVRNRVEALLLVALEHFHLVLVLDGVDHLLDIPVTAYAGPRKLDVLDMIRERRAAEAGTRGGTTDPFFDTPQPLWWFPLDLPARLHLVISCADKGPCWDAAHVRQWTRNTAVVAPLSQHGCELLLGGALARAGGGHEWGQNCFLRLSTMLSDVVPDGLSVEVTEMAKPPPPPPVDPDDEAVKKRGRKAPEAPPVDNLADLMPMAGEQLKVAVIRFLTHDVSTEGREKVQVYHMPGFLRLCLARLSFADNLRELFAVLVAIRRMNKPSCFDLACELLDLIVLKFPLAVDVLGFLYVCHKGLQEFELLELMGASGFGPVNPQRHGITRVFKLERGRAAAASGPVNPFDLAAAANEVAKGRNPESGQAVLPALPSDAPVFTMVEWSQLRHLLLSFAITRGRGLYALEGGFIRAAVEKVVVPVLGRRMSLLQRVVGYFWMQAPGQRKAEVLPAAMLQLLYMSHQTAAANKEEAPAAAATEPSGPRRLTKRRAAASPFHGLSPAMMASKSPGLLFSVGLPAEAAFPAEPRLLAGRLVAAFMNLPLLSFASGMGGWLYHGVLHSLLLSGKSPNHVLSAIRAEFEAHHDIARFDKSPQYHLIKHAKIVLPEEPPEPEAAAPGRPHRAAAKDDGLLPFIGIQWQRFRRNGARDLLCTARILRALGHYLGAQADLDASMMLNTSTRSYDAVDSLASKLFHALDQMGIPRSKALPPSVTPDVGVGIETGALARGHNPWAIPAQFSAGLKPPPAESGSNILHSASVLATNAVKRRGRNPTICDVEDLARCLHDMFDMAKERFDAHLAWIAINPPNEEHMRKARTMAVWDIDPFQQLHRLEIAWKLSRQFDRIIGPNHHLMEAVNRNYQYIIKLPIPPKKDYMRRRLAFF